MTLRNKKVLDRNTPTVGGSKTNTPTLDIVKGDEEVNFRRPATKPKKKDNTITKEPKKKDVTKAKEPKKKNKTVIKEPKKSDVSKVR
jgi:hypothetical protein